MATLALSVAGQVVGGAIGGPVGATIGRALGALAGGAVDNALFGERPSRAQSDVRLTGSSEGGPIPRIYGWSRVSGNIIWATELERIAAESSGIKGFGRGAEEDTIAASFALALCEGEVAHLGRIWADGKLLETDGLDIRFYRGTNDQEPDGFIMARQGAAPAYRGICYLVVERLDLTPFGNRIPNISVEICRPVGDLERDIRAVCVIPGSTEFGYDPRPRVRVLGPGRSEAENCHLSGARSDWDISIDELVALCPNLEHVGLVVSWFGTDLRCGECLVEPRVEGRDKEVKGASWSVAGRSRGAANVVSSHEGGPAYGGTPSDTAVKAAIADLRARGLKVTLYPFVMMDIPHANGLVDPYTLGAGQSAYPWRGRITCHPAPGVKGSPDGTGAAAGQVAAFMGNGYREMILHYARLGRDAGGIDAMLIGSEMRGLTWVRSGASSFPFVDALRGLAGEVRAIVGAATKITYAADWSEYSGLQPDDAPGDKIFHLDPLWADNNIDAIGIDNYMPLADWRDGESHEDAEVAGSIHDLDYLKGNIAGGEGYDWFYASQADREAQVRSPISDGAHGEDWIWRYKDLENFWSLPHHDRIGGVRSETPTAWVPFSKPYWLTELGCGAVDKGPNAPNAFGDPKSAEDARPPFSSGTPDPLVQRQALRACHHYWREAAHNPTSPVYGGPMLDTGRIYLWCWDARPYPAFPGMAEVWSDAANYETGHWLNGRLGSAGADELLAAMAKDFGVTVSRIDAKPPLVRGLGVEAVASLRDASASLVEALGLAVLDTDQGIAWRRGDAREVATLAREDLAAADGALLSRKRSDPAEMAGRLTLNYFDRDRDYQTASVLAVSPKGERNAGAETGLVLDPADARAVAEGMLGAMRRAGDTLELALPPSLMALEAGDLIGVDGVADGPFVVDAVRDGAMRSVSASARGETVVGTIAAPPRRVPQMRPPIAVTPVIAVAHLPAADGGTELVAAAFAEPWPGSVSLRDAGTGSELGVLTAPGTLGELTLELGEGPRGVWDRAGELEVRLYGGHLASAEPQTVLASANRLAVLTDAGHWEVVGFERAELVGPAIYRLTGLLRGLDTTRSGVAGIGNRVMVLDRHCLRVATPHGALGDRRAFRAYAGSRDAEGVELAVDVDFGAALPLAPAHLAARRDVASGDVRLSWVRRSRIDGNAWTFADVPLDFSPERYRVSILDGGAQVRAMTVGGAELIYSAVEQIADFGSLPATFGFAVEQISPVLGPGHRARGVFS
ncbi:glycoside hydrolase/phage tail family protein [Pelagibacterium sp. 26DY04]|uniref:baseplate multidomain protein megatron n=1 Tax=Pelagibacterium sp. 26DY04 TaxID=2967130 RepID=UPI002815CFE8|nr:glycoside hydrolase/phage tail family protein [Pelagibacterium sp. 26DY04]WMT88072.1 glycoside hydrolase/phage tail family protein [Pelagibacterium sp. 26DY04]